jgi:hypothetical protein
MTLPRYYALKEEWSNAPPVRRVLAAYFGIKPKRRRNPEAGGFEDLIRMFAPNGKTTVIR